MTDTTCFAPFAWIGGRFVPNVRLGWDSMGRFSEVATGVEAPRAGERVLPGPVLPGLVNAHSHAFQRACAGLLERRVDASDDFWSWREGVYATALKMSAAQLQAIAAQLYVELLRGGYTQVCEFHYLHRQEDGSAYSDPFALAWALADAAAGAGVGLTLLPAVYERAGFSRSDLRPEQRRFASDVAYVRALRDAVERSGRPELNAGLALHSLRAVTPGSLHAIRDLAEELPGPIHLHIAEQTAEVDDCRAATGLRPIEWLARERVLSPNWQLVHAIHATPAEIESVAESGAGVVLCPTTEANLGDGIADARLWLDAGVPLSIGSDSQVCRRAIEEIRWLEYTQRLARRARNVCADPTNGASSTAARLFQRLVKGGASAAGWSHAGIEVGARADFIVLPLRAPGMLGIPASHWLDAWVFAVDAAEPRSVFVAGKEVVHEGVHFAQDEIEGRFESAMAALHDR